MTHPSTRSGPRLRPAAAGDAPAVAALHLAAWQAAYGAIVPAGYLEALRADDREREWRDRLANLSGREGVLVSDGPDGLDGFVYYGRKEVPGQGEIYRIYVDPGAQGRGIGRALLAAAENDLATAGCTDLVLWTFAENTAAHGFYRSCGWAPDGRTGSWNVGGRECPEVAFVKVVKSPAAGSSIPARGRLLG